jgi:serine/threonine-protein kinase
VLVAAGVLLALVAATAGAFVLGRSWTGPGAPAGVRRATVRLAVPLALGKHCPLGVGRTAVALSPDGSLLVYAGEQNGGALLFARPLDSFDSRPIPGTEGAYSPFFSPDGGWVAFFAANTLRKVSLQGGQPVVLCEARIPHGGTWGPNGTIVFSDGEGARLVRVSASGGAPETIVTPQAFGPGYWGLSDPGFLPGGDTVLVTLWKATNPEYFHIAAVSVKSGTSHVVLEGGTGGRYLASGHLVYARGTTVIATPFDARTATVTGPGAALVENVRGEEWGSIQFGLSTDGTLVYVPGGPAWIGKLVWVDRAGAATPISAPARAYQQLSISPDGRRVAVGISEATRDI